MWQRLSGGRLVDFELDDNGRIQSQNRPNERPGLSRNEEVGGGWGCVYIVGWWANLRVPRPTCAA
jgi:hypothetical protein